MRMPNLEPYEKERANISNNEKITWNANFTDEVGAQEKELLYKKGDKTC